MHPNQLISDTLRWVCAALAAFDAFAEACKAEARKELAAKGR